MNQPNFEMKEILVSKKNMLNNFSIKVLNDNLICSIVSMGNPHCVIQVECINNAPVKKIGKILENHSIFLQGINVGFMKIINRNHIKIRVYERDVGETQACGSGACAAVAIGIVQNLLDNNVTVDLLGGSLKIKWQGFNHPLYMIGSANHIYDGYVYI